MEMGIAKKVLKSLISGQMKSSVDMDAQGVELHLF